MKYMTPKEFREFGFLQELNRQFLHPLGLALEVAINDDGTERFGAVWDCRDEPEGIYFEQSVISPEKARRVADLSVALAATRMQKLGYVRQPVGNEEANSSKFLKDEDSDADTGSR